MVYAPVEQMSLRFLFVVLDTQGSSTRKARLPLHRTT